MQCYSSLIFYIFSQLFIHWQSSFAEMNSTKVFCILWVIFATRVCIISFPFEDQLEKMGDSDFVGMNRDNEMQTPLFDVGGTGGRQHIPVTEQSRQVKPSPVPSIVWLVMKITCLFSARYLTVERTCFRCQVDRFRRLYVVSLKQFITFLR